MTVRVAVLASGRGSNLKSIIDYLDARRDAASAKIVLVASNRASAGALRHASNANIESRVFDSTDDGTELLSLLREHDIGLVTLAGYLKRIPHAVVREFTGRIVNVHPGLLPDFGGAGMYGANVHAAVIAKRAKTSGVTIHLVDDEFDHGPVVAQWKIPVREDDTAESLAARVLEVEHIVYPRVVDMIAALTDHHFSTDI
jgi:formyltetrahydrofolate-dependent phosphoribosylglycinamide formyltransferase